MIREEEVYNIGRIGKPHGIKGEITMQFSDDVFDRVDADFLVLDIDGILVPFFMEEYRFRSDSVAIIKFCDIDTQEQARELTGCNVFFPRKLTDDSENAPTWAQLRGYKLKDVATGKVVGIIHGVDDSTPNILFEIMTAEGQELLIPAPEEFIKSFDTSRQEICMQIPDGLLDLI